MEQDYESKSQQSLTEEDMQNMEQMAKPKSTTAATVYGVNRFQDWLQRKGKTCDFMTITADELNEFLRKLYAEVKPKKQGGSLTPSAHSD